MVTLDRHLRVTPRGEEMLRVIQYMLGGTRHKVALEHALETAVGLILTRRLLDEDNLEKLDVARNDLLLAALNYGEDEDEANLQYRMANSTLQCRQSTQDEWVDWVQHRFGRKLEADDHRWDQPAVKPAIPVSARP